ncbi:hypothetical protein TI05_08410 [Achromatium sp. WMS3]|nr:hypothetical protein TI05_08410 [Achromatium sp. WMS3]
MRKIIFALLLLGITSQSQAGLLSHGNVFAEGVAGCAIGMGIGLAAGTGIMYFAPIAGATSTYLANVGGLSGCVTGVVVSLALNHLIYGIPNFTYPIGNDDTRIYPKTYGKKY